MQYWLVIAGYESHARGLADSERRESERRSHTEVHSEGEAGTAGTMVTRMVLLPLTRINMSDVIASRH